MEVEVPALVINDLCVACDYCKFFCPEKAIINIDNQYIIEQWACTLCEICVAVCPTDAIKKVKI